MLECCNAIAFFTEFIDEEPEAKRGDMPVLWVTRRGRLRG